MKCNLCGDENTKKLEVKAKQGYGYINFDDIYLCNKCIDKCSNDLNILWNLLMGKGKIEIKE